VIQGTRIDSVRKRSDDSRLSTFPCAANLISRSINSARSLVKEPVMIGPLDPRMLRRVPRCETPERTFSDKLSAQWPAFAGLLLMGLGVLVFLVLRNTSDWLATRCPAVFIAAGMGLLAYWALANRNDDYTSV
jgi:hypothetical protein